MLKEALYLVEAYKNSAGVVARPLYVCTSIVGGLPGGRNAAVSALFQFPLERVHWHCDRCASIIAPSSASADSRGVEQYGRVDDFYASLEWSAGGLVHVHIAYWIVGAPRIDKVVVPRQSEAGVFEVDVTAADAVVLPHERAANVMSTFWDRVICEFNVAKHAKEGGDKGTLRSATGVRST